MDILFKTIYNSDNPAAEYQKRGATWYKRKKGSDEKWYKVDKKYFANLNAKNEKSGFLYNYTTASKIAAVTLIAFVIYKAVKK